jgi:hypothetical protein
MTEGALAVHEFFIFERSGRLLFHRNFSRAEGVADERGKLVYGVLFSLKQMIPSLAPPDQITEEGIRSLTTGAFTLHSFESPTGYRFAVVTSVSSILQQLEVRANLEKIFSEIFVNLVMMDPTYKPGSKIESVVFDKSVATALRRIGVF